MYYLELYVSLLDHDLKGDLFESAVIRFLVVITIDPIKGILKEAYHFIPNQYEATNRVGFCPNPDLAR
jgi:hypothetical protein